MLDALTYRKMMNDIKRNQGRDTSQEDTIGILLTKPDLETGRSIQDRLAYYHFRTGCSVHFYLPGYGASWKQAYADRRAVTTIDGTQWSFSSEMFMCFVREMERRSEWRYSGSSELIFITYKNKELLYDKMMIFYPDRMLRDGVICSMQQFFDVLFNLCRSEERFRIVKGKPEIEHLKILKVELLAEKIPAQLGDIYLQGKHYDVRGAGLKGAGEDAQMTDARIIRETG